MNYKKTYTVLEATKTLEHFCAYQERCHKEVEKKLNELRMIPEAKEQIIIHLIQNNFLNEERFAKAFVRGKFTIKKWGKRRIISELKFRAISSYNIKASLNEIDDKLYLETLAEIAEKKVKLIKESNSLKKKQKLIQFLHSKGYESELVYQTVNSIIT
jgi:regulatory protein